MRQTTMILLSAIVLMSGIAMMEIGERMLTAGAFAIVLVVVVFLYRRFRRSAGEVPWIFQAAVAIGVTLGVLTALIPRLAAWCIRQRSSRWLSANASGRR